MPVKKESILIVDDNEANLFSLASLLEQEGYTVSQVNNGVDSLKIINSGDFDLVLLDLMMPLMDGFETINQIRAKYTMLDLPVIIITIRDEEQMTIRALEAGANDYIVKPISNTLTIARVKTQLKLKRLFREK